MVCLKSRTLISLVHELRVIAEDCSLGTDEVQLKIRRLDMFLEKLIDHRSLTTVYIEMKRFEVARSVDQSLDLKRYDIKNLEEIVDDIYYKHHGRSTEKHTSIREQEDQIRILRRNVVHRCKSVAAEKRLIKELKNVEKTRAKIVANGVHYKLKWWSWWVFNSVKEYEDHIKACRAAMTRLRKHENVREPVSEVIDRADKYLQLEEKELSMLENELKKINEMEVEIVSLRRSLEKQLHQKKLLSHSQQSAFSK